MNCAWSTRLSELSQPNLHHAFLQMDEDEPWEMIKRHEAERDLMLAFMMCFHQRLGESTCCAYMNIDENIFVQFFSRHGLYSSILHTKTMAQEYMSRVSLG